MKSPQPEILDALERCVTADDFPKNVDDEMCALNCFGWNHGLDTRQYEPSFERLPRCQVRQWIEQVKYHDRLR